MNDPLVSPGDFPARSHLPVGVGSLQDTPDTTTGDVTERAKVALEDVTEGPWTFQHWGEQNQNGDYAESILFDGSGETMVYGLADKDGEFIAASRTLVPDLVTEVERLHSWDGLMSLLDEHWPEDIFPTLPDTDRRDPGPRIVSLLRWVDKLKAQVPTVNYANHFCPKGCDCSCCYGYGDRSCHCFADPCNCGGDRQAHGQKPLP